MSRCLCVVNANDVWFRSSRSMRVTAVWNRWLALAHVTYGLHVALVKFADKRRSWQHVQLDLLYTIDRPWLILHAELSSRCSERVSILILEFSANNRSYFNPLYLSPNGHFYEGPFLTTKIRAKFTRFESG